MNTWITLIDWILFIPLAFCVGYLFFFAIASRFQSHLIDRKFKPQKQHRFLVLFPAYKEDRVIADSVSSFAKIKIYPTSLLTTSLSSPIICSRKRMMLYVVLV